MKYQKFERLYLVLPKHNTKAREKSMSIPMGEVLDTLTLYRMEITPDLARQFLEHGNPLNRKISDGTIAAYANDMMNDEWDFGAVNPIVFDKDGTMRNGHHRINAVIRAGVPIIAYVAVGADPSNTYDIGRVRTINNTLELDGINTSTSATALIRSVGLFCFGVTKASRGEIKKAYLTDSEGISTTIKAACKGSTRPIMKHSQFLAAIYCAYKCGVSIEALNDFARIANTGIPDNSNQTAPIVIRNQALNKVKNEYSDKKSLFLCTQEAIRDFVSGVRRTKAYTGKTAMYSTQFADAFRAGTLYGGKP